MLVRKLLSWNILFLVSLSPASQAMTSSPPPSLETLTRKITAEILNGNQAYANLESLTLSGHRLCGSSGAAQAVEWAKAKLESYDLDRVWLQPVKVPHWVRGNREIVQVTSTPRPVSLRATALGNSAGTPAGGIEAEVIEVQSRAEVEQLGNKVRGKIVFYNRPMDPTLESTFAAYGKAVDQRSRGPSVAAQAGAVATLVRSMTTLTDDPHPHTGVTFFNSAREAIPAAALSTRDADILAKLVRTGKPVRLKIELSAQTLPDVESFNVVGEIRGSEIPQEIVLAGGHLDSWDLSVGAHDDGAGVVQAIEVVRAIKALGIRPKRTVRAVLFMCEENSAAGADEYARLAQVNAEKHILATESDHGGFQPKGFSVDDSTGKALARIQSWSSYLAPLQADYAVSGEGGTDVDPLAALGTPTAGLLHRSNHYFDYHHSELDVLTAVKPEELQAGGAAMAVLSYLAAELGM